MTTVTDLKKTAASSGFIENMNGLGFECGPGGFWFYRVRGDYIDFIDFWIKTSGNHMTVPVSCLKLSIVDHCDMKNFPKGFQKGTPIHSDSFINEEYGVEIGGDPWRICDEADTVEALSGIYTLIKDSANDWFQNINTDIKLYESFSIRMQETELGEKLKSLLVG